MTTEKEILYDCSTDFLHELRVYVGDPTKPRFVCVNCGIWFNAVELSALTTFLAEPNLFNYGISLYNDFFHRSLAWDIIDAAVEIALLKLPPEQLDQLKRVKQQNQWTDEDLTSYEFRTRHGVTRNLDKFHWHTWRVVEKLLERDGFYREQKEEKEKEVPQQSKNGVGLHQL